MKIIKSFGLFFCKVVCVLGIITALGWTIMEVSGARIRFGSAYLEDTLTGGVSIGSGRLYAWDSARIAGVDIEDGQVKAPNGIAFSNSNSFIDDDGGDIRYTVVNNGTHYLMTGGTEVFSVDSNKITFNKPFIYSSGAIGGYKEISGLLWGHNDTLIARIIFNNSGRTITTQYNNTGEYTMFISGSVIDTNKMIYYITNTASFNLKSVVMEVGGTNNFDIWTQDIPTATAENEILRRTPFYIRIYN